MASRGMSLKKKKKRQQPSPFAQTYHATSGRSSRLLWAWVKQKKKNRKYAQLPLRTGFNTVYIAPVVVWKWSQP